MERSKSRRFFGAVGASRHRLSDDCWRELKSYSGGDDLAVSKLVGDSLKILQSWSEAKASRSGTRFDVDQAGLEALEALRIGFDKLGKSRSHEAMREILSMISPAWGGGRFSIIGQEERDVIWPQDISWKISEFLDRDKGGRPRLDDIENQVAAEGIVSAWIACCNKPPGVSRNKSRGSIYSFYRTLIDNTRIYYISKTGRGKNSNFAEHRREEILLSIEREVKRRQDAKSATRRSRKAAADR